jgi:hypothetical protein
MGAQETVPRLGAEKVQLHAHRVISMCDFKGKVPGGDDSARSSVEARKGEG